MIEYANPAFKRITGYDPADIVGRDCRFLQRDDLDQEGLNAIRTGLAANREVSAVLRNYRKDGVLFWNQLFIAPVPDAQGNTTHHIGVINDVTEVDPLSGAARISGELRHAHAPAQPQSAAQPAATRHRSGTRRGTLRWPWFSSISMASRTSTTAWAIA